MRRSFVRCAAGLVAVLGAGAMTNAQTDAQPCRATWQTNYPAGTVTVQMRMLQGASCSIPTTGASYAIGASPQHGALAVERSVARYTPASDYVGSDAFSL